MADLLTLVEKESSGGVFSKVDRVLLHFAKVCSSLRHYPSFDYLPLCFLIIYACCSFVRVDAGSFQNR